SLNLSARSGSVNRALSSTTPPAFRRRVSCSSRFCGEQRYAARGPPDEHRGILSLHEHKGGITAHGGKAGRVARVTSKSRSMPTREDRHEHRHEHRQPRPPRKAAKSAIARVWRCSKFMTISRICKRLQMRSLDQAKEFRSLEAGAYLMSGVPLR